MRGHDPVPPLDPPLITGFTLEPCCILIFLTAFGYYGYVIVQFFMAVGL